MFHVLTKTLDDSYLVTESLYYNKIAWFVCQLIFYFNKENVPILSARKKCSQEGVTKW